MDVTTDIVYSQSLQQLLPTETESSTGNSYYYKYLVSIIYFDKCQMSWLPQDKLTTEEEREIESTSTKEGLINR